MPHKSVTKWGIYSLKKYLGVDQLLYHTSTECSRRLMECVGKNLQVQIFSMSQPPFGCQPAFKSST